MTRFSLPQFSIKEDPETWFSCADQIFETQRIESDFEKYGILMQNLAKQDVTLILDTVKNVDNTSKYQLVKATLIRAYGLSEKISKFLEGASINANQKPSMILYKLCHLPGAAGANEQLSYT